MITYDSSNAPSKFISDDGVTVPSGQEHLRRLSYLSKPDTARRPKPVDLFANGTERRIESVNVKYSDGKLSNSPWNGWSTEAPMTYWSGVSANTRITEPSGADFDRLDNKMRGKIKDQTMNLAQAVGELDQTRNLLFSTARDVVKSFHSLRSGRSVAQLMSILKHPDTRNGKKLANRWLELQYGWIPLINDVIGGAEALAKGLKEGITRFQTVTNNDAEVNVTRDALGETTTVASLDMRVRARYTISAPDLKLVSELGFANPMALAWEFLPYSFVVDKIIPIGDYLDGIDALTGIHDLVVARSFKLQTRASRILDYSDSVSTFSPQPRGVEVKTISHRFGTGSQLSFGSLQFKPKVSATNAVSAIALLRQLFNK